MVREIMTDNLPEAQRVPEKGPEPVSPAILELGKAMGRFSVAPTADATLRLREAMAEADTDYEIAKALARNIEVDDPHFRNLDLKNNEDQKNATALSIGKAEAAKEDQSLKERKKLTKFQRTLSSRYARGAVAAVLPIVAAACGPIIAPEPQPTEPVVTEIVDIPTASPEAISSLNESAQRFIDEAFEGPGIHSVSLVGGGILRDSSGNEFTLFTSKLPDTKNDTDLDFLIIGEIDGSNQIGTAKGLVIDETQAQGPILEFIAVSFSPETQTFVIESPYIRTNTDTNEIEIYKDGLWQILDGPDKTIEEIQERLGGGVLAAPALPTPTAPSPEVWDYSQEIPEIHSENARFETSEDGTGRIIFTHEGSEYVIPIDKPEGKIIDINGEEIVDGAIDVRFFSKLYETIEADSPLVIYKSDGETLAWYDIKADEWIYRYETLFERDEYPPLSLPWIKSEGGFVNSREGGQEEIISRLIIFAGRVKRVFTEKALDKDKFVRIYWMTVTYGNEDKTVDVLLFFEEDGYDTFRWTNPVVISEGDSNYYGPWFMPDESRSYSQEEILNALKESSYVQIEMDLWKKENLESVYSYPDLISLPFANNLERSAYLQYKFLEEHQKFADALLGGDFEGVEEGFQLGHGGLWIFLPPK